MLSRLDLLFTAVCSTGCSFKNLEKLDLYLYIAQIVDLFSRVTLIFRKSLLTFRVQYGIEARNNVGSA